MICKALAVVQAQLGDVLSHSASSMLQTTYATTKFGDHFATYDVCDSTSTTYSLGMCHELSGSCGWCIQWARETSNFFQAGNSCKPDSHACPFSPHSTGKVNQLLFPAELYYFGLNEEFLEKIFNHVQAEKNVTLPWSMRGVTTPLDFIGNYTVSCRSDEGGNWKVLHCHR